MIRKPLILGGAALLAGLMLSPAARADDPTADAIAGRMGGVVDSLGKKQTGTPVQGEQKGIVEDLDALIASLEKECQNCKGGIKRTGGQGARESEIRSGTGEMGALTNPDDGGKDWGKLSDRERDRILQSQTEGFPPEYRTVLERYYRRLAEEKSAKTAGEGAKTRPVDVPAKP